MNGHIQPLSIREVEYASHPHSAGGIEVTDLASLRRRGGRTEFVDTQRLLFELVVCVGRGRTTHEVDFTTYEVAAGDVIWVHAGQVHRWGRLDQIEGTVIMFAESAVDSATADILHRFGAMARNHWRNMAVPNSVVAETLDLLVTHAHRHSAIESSDTTVHDTLLRTTTAGLLLSLVADHPDSPPATSTDERLLTFRAEVGRHFTHDRSVASYARRLGYSERTLHRLVINGTGRSPKQIIDERVILEAKRLLVHGGLPIDTIARALGFDDQSNFTKFFKKSVGSGPRDFRAANS